MDDMSVIADSYEPDLKVKVLAFLERVIRRTVGQGDGWGEKMEERAARYTALLQRPLSDLRRKVVAESLAREFDLLDCEYANNPKLLDFQVLIIRLAESDPVMKWLADEMHWDGKIIPKLFEAILEKAEEMDASELKFEARGDGTVHLDYLCNGSWEEVMTAPKTLKPPIWGFLKLVEAAGYERMRPYLSKEKQTPQNLNVRVEESAAHLVIAR